jgi:phosphoadenosine phosphosulfate reductase
MPQLFLDGIEPNDRQRVNDLPLSERVDRATALLRDNEPDGGYYLAFSGGKDSVVIKHLALLAGVQFEPWYNNTTIDPPELVRFIKRHHADVKWSQPEHGNMFYRIATNPAAPPTRQWRWCCSEYKEGNGNGRVKVFGVRAAESATRKHFWREISVDVHGDTCICPVVYWLDAQIWEHIRHFGLPYCQLYDEGMSRLGCVACPLKSEKQQQADFVRWPKYAAKWRAAVVANWERWKDVPNSKTGKPRFQARFKTADEFWHWWLTHKHPDVNREDCQSGILWTNEDETELEALAL